MNIFVIPSWYPSEFFPSTGIFFREQAELIARYRPDWNVGISTWGSHDPRLWIKKSRPLDALIKVGFKSPLKFREEPLHANCIEFFNPAFTWTRRIKKGNIDGIIAANQMNFNRFTMHHGKPDFIHAHVSYPAGYVAAALAERNGVPFLITEHMGPFPFDSMRSKMDRLILTPMKKASTVMAVSQNLTNQIRSFGIDATKTSNFIDDEFFSPGTVVSGDQFRFLYVGRLVKGKGLDILIKAFSKIGRDVHLTIAGSGPLEKNLRLLAQSLKLSNVEFIGERAREQVRDCFRACNSFVLPSLHENQPVSILEALSCGKPVVATICGGSEELLTAQNGLLAKAGNIEDLQRMLTQMVDQKFDSDEIRIGFLSQFGTKNTIDKLERVYRGILH